MAMRYRHLRETAREAVGVFRSNIHGRGLFCKRDIDSGEMVIEYAGQVGASWPDHDIFMSITFDNYKEVFSLYPMFICLKAFPHILPHTLHCMGDTLLWPQCVREH